MSLHSTEPHFSGLLMKSSVLRLTKLQTMYALCMYLKYEHLQHRLVSQCEVKCGTTIDTEVNFTSE